MLPHLLSSLCASTLLAPAFVSAFPLPGATRAEGQALDSVQRSEVDLAAAFEVPEGLEVTLWAESPRLFNPTAIDVDARGRIWATEGVNYRQWSGRNPGKHREGGDQVVILEDTDGDGFCDDHKVFVQDPDLTAPLGIALVGNRVYVSCSPNLFVYIDEDGDDIADRRETVLTGFGGFDHDHGLHSVVPHTDGKLYVAVGNAGPHIVEGPDGKVLRSGSLYSGGGPVQADNRPGLVSGDGKVWTGGLVLRMNHDGSELEVMAHNFRNIYEVAVDAFGEMFTADNDDDGNRACRTTWVMRGGNYGFFSADGSRTWQADRRPGLTTQEAHWHAADPGVVPAGTINGAGGPTGVCIYEGDLMAEWFDGAVLNCDAGARVVYAHRPREQGSGIALDPGFAIRTAKDAGGEAGQWFRPSDVAVGPSGAIYVADWYDPGVGGHAAGDRKAYGRILKIAPAGIMTPSPRVDVSTTEGAIRALGSPAVAVRELGRAALVAQGRAAVQPMLSAMMPMDDRRAARVATVLSRISPKQLPSNVFAQRSAGAARWSMDVRDRVAGGLAPVWHRSVLAAPRVAREWAQTAPADMGSDFTTGLLESFDPEDPWLVEAIAQMFDRADAGDTAAYWAAAPEDPLGWSGRFEALAWRLHPKSVTAGFRQRAMAGELPAAARRRAIDALAFTKSYAAAEGVYLVATAGPEDLRAYAAWWLEHRSTNDWQSFGLRLQAGSIADAEKVFESEVMQEGHRAVEIDVTRATKLWVMVTDGGDGNSCDWAAVGNPRFKLASGKTIDASAGWLEAKSGWGSVGSGVDSSGGSLEFSDGAIERGIGTHAPSQIALAVPAGAVRFLADIGPEQGGVSQQDGQSTSVAFEIWCQLQSEAKPLLDWIGLVTNASTPIDSQLAALQKLSADPMGALLLIRAKEEERLPGSLVPEAARLLFSSSDLAVQALASEQFERPGAGFPSTPLSLTPEGDPARGRALFQDTTRARCAACHAYQSGDTRIGVDLGPELTMIHKKLTGEALYEAIRNPSASIAFGYDTYVIATDDGLLYSGFLIADGETVVLLGTDGERIVFDADEITARRKQSVSTMPDGLALELSAQELADIVAFLAEAPDTRGTEGEDVVLFDGGSMDAWTHWLGEASVPFDDVWSVKDGVLRCEGKPTGYLKTKETFQNYRLRLQWRFDPEAGPGNSGVLLRTTGPDRIWPRSIEAQLQHRSAGDFWNIGEVAMTPSASRTRGRNTKRAAPSSERPIGEWNDYDILVDGPRVELRVNGVLQNTADWCEEIGGAICLQSEGAVIEFRDIRLKRLTR